MEIRRVFINAQYRTHFTILREVANPSVTQQVEDEDLLLIADFFRANPVIGEVNQEIAYCADTKKLATAIKVGKILEFRIEFEKICIVLGIKHVRIPVDYFKGYFHFRDDCLERITIQIYDENNGNVNNESLVHRSSTITYAIKCGQVPCPNCFGPMVEGLYRLQ